MNEPRRDLEPPIIGNLDWDTCEFCKHSDMEEGGCDVPLTELNDGLEIYLGDWIVCGCFEARED